MLKAYVSYLLDPMQLLVAKKNVDEIVSKSQERYQMFNKVAELIEQSENKQAELQKANATKQAEVDKQNVEPVEEPTVQPYEPTKTEKTVTTNTTE